MDHDQRFKLLIQEFFAEFILLFFPAWAARFDFRRVEWLQQEVFLDPPQGRRRIIDLVAKLLLSEPAAAGQAVSDGHWLAIVHIEIEHRDTVEPLRAAVFDLYKQLRQRHRLPVLPIGLYLQVGLQGAGWDAYEEHFWGERLVHFRFPYVGLPALDATHYANGANVLGIALAVLMRVPAERRAELAAQVLQRLAQCGENEYRRFLLAECALAYSGLDEEQRRHFEQLLANEPYREAQAMTTTFYEEGIQKGLQQGLQQGQEQGQRQALEIQMEQKWGPLSPAIRQHLEGLPNERVQDLLRRVLTASSLRELGLEA